MLFSLSGNLLKKTAFRLYTVGFKRTRQVNSLSFAFKTDRDRGIRISSRGLVYGLLGRAE